MGRADSGAGDSTTRIGQLCPELGIEIEIHTHMTDLGYTNERLQKTRWRLMMSPGPGEQEAVRALQDAGFMPVRQYIIRGKFVDVALPEHRIAVEIDSSNKLKKRSQRARQAQIESAGWRVIRVLSSAPGQVVDAVREALN